MQFRDLEENIISKELSVSDMIVKRFSKGNFVMVEETVADRGDKFIKGKKVRFKDSFIPDITTMISNAGIPQLVLIFKPVAYFNDKLDPESIKFADDAENYFISNNISYINFMKDNRIAIKFYANGDHYNQEGREFITKIVGEKLNFQLENIN